MFSNPNIKKFVTQCQQIPALSQIYHHVYFRDLNEQLIAANSPTLNVLRLQTPLINPIPYAEIMEQSDLGSILENDNLVLHKQEPTIFLEHFHQDFLSIKSPVYSENNLVGLCGISLFISQYNLTEFFDILKEVDRFLLINFSDLKKVSLYKNQTKWSASLNRPKLTARERDCLSLYMVGNSTREIASKLSLSARTIEFYIEKIKLKFEVNKRSQLLTLAFELYPELVNTHYEGDSRQSLTSFY